MSTKKARALILAAGRGTRMNSHKTKMLHNILDRTMIEYVVAALDLDDIERIGLIVGEHNLADIQAVLGRRVDYILQSNPLGTGHAVRCAETWLKGFEGKCVVVVGDAPLLDKLTVSRLLSEFDRDNYAVVLLSAIFDSPPPYGRVVRDSAGAVIKLVEEKDADSEEKKICEVSTSHYCFDTKSLFSALHQITNQNAQGEYYLPDVIEIFIRKGLKVGAFPVSDPMVTFGVNTMDDLDRVEKLMRLRKNNAITPPEGG